VVLAAALTLVSAPGKLDAYEIFARAREYWESQHYPQMLQYDVAVRVVEGRTVRIERYASGYDDENATIAFDPISDEERAHPFRPHGINLVIPGLNVSKPQTPVDYLGVPILAPNYSFGIGTTPLTPPPQPPTDAELVREIRAEFHDPNPRWKPAPSPSPDTRLHEIAEVVSKERNYQITLAGVDAVDGSEAYHLKMRPLRDPGRYRLRDLWVDTATFAPRKLLEALNFVNGPGTTVPWSVTFADTGGALYIATETALAPMRYRRITYSQASVSVENVRPVDQFSSDLSTFVPSDGPLLMEEP